MNHTGFRKALEDLGLSQVEFARVIGIDPRTVRRWALGAQDIPNPIVVVLWYMERNPLDIAALPPFEEAKPAPLTLSRGVPMPKAEKKAAAKRR